MTKPDKPNILFLFADQLRSHALGCYGNDQVHTPHMDLLAAEGVQFTHAISTAPVCGPFRGMLMTGNYPMKNGMLLTDHFLRNPGPHFAEVCREAGYATAYIGKWHLDGYDRQGPIPPERRRGFDYWRGFECSHDYFESKYYHQDETEPRTWPDYDAMAQTEDACRYISDKGNDPFCLFVSWGPPHGPYMGVRTKQYTYARKSDTNTPWLLYDNRKDPYQVKNLVDTPSHQAVQSFLDRRTDELLSASGEPGDPAVYARIIQREREVHRVKEDQWDELMPPRVSDH